MKIIILADFKITAETKAWLKTELEKLGYETELLGIPDYNEKDETTGIGKIKTWIKYFRLSLSGIKKSGKQETIITDNFVIGAITAFLCQVSGSRRKIIALNMIAHKKGFINRLIRKFIYNIAFRYKTLWFSVNDKELIERYAQQFKFPTSRIFVLHDSFSSKDEQGDYQCGGDFVFTGGDAFRDWAGVIESAENLPAIQFIGVARRKYFPVDRKLPENLKMYYDIPPDEFYSLLKKSRIVFLPLNSLAPCGLIVMLKAALLCKPVIITETPSTKNYVQNNISGRLIKMNDKGEMKSSILELYNSAELRRMYSESLKKYVLANFSPEKSAAIVNKVIAE